MRLLVFTMLTELNASSRVHCYQFSRYLAGGGVRATFCAPSSKWLFQVCNGDWPGLPKPLVAALRRFYWYIWVPIKRLLFIGLAPIYDLVFVERGLLMHCSRPWLEALLFAWAHLWRKRVVYFFDDAIYIDCPAHIRSVVSKADTVVTVTTILAEYALGYNPNVVVFEDAVDLDRYALNDFDNVRDKETMVIGWVGNSTVGFRYLDQLREPLLELFERHPNLVFRVISGRDFEFQGSGVPVDNVRWRLDREDSVTFDIGLAPLLQTEYDRAKASFKILQYWAHGVPVVCSQSADNFLEDGVNCLIAREPEEWVENLSLLVERPDLGRELGMRGRRLVEDRFALDVKGPSFVALLKGIAAGSTDVEYFTGAADS